MDPADDTAPHKLVLLFSLLLTYPSTITFIVTMFAARLIVLLCSIVSVFGFTKFGASYRATVAVSAGKSESLPFLPQPPNLVGLTAQKGFDPVGFSNIFDIKWLQEAEIKHARTAMLGVLGWVVADFVKLPGDIHQISNIEAHDVFVKNGAFGQVFITIAILEAVSLKAIKEMREGSGRLPGEFGFDPLNLSKGNKEKFVEKELANGRLAMLAFGGIVTQAVLTGKGFPYY